MELSPEKSAEQLKQLFKYGYGSKIAVRTGNSLHFTNNLGSEIDTVDIVIYLHYEKKVAVVWDNHYRRKMGSTTKNFSWEKDYNETAIASGLIDIVTKYFKTPSGDFLEKILIMSFDTLVENYDHLYSLLSWDESDNTILTDVDIPEVPNRGRRTVSQWNRDCDFRNKVLDAYGVQCAICRCSERKLLEAAHIIAVADGGSDDVANGICLCANHHRMLDKKLIEIDYKKLELKYVAVSVKNMPWYEAFKVYGNKIVPRKKEK